MPMNDSDVRAVKKLAIHRLAIATGYLLPQEPKALDLWWRVYLDGLEPFHPNTVVAVCSRLETHARDGWFPKLPELVQDMKSYVQRIRDQAKPSLQIQGKPVTPDQIAALRDRVAVEVARKRMR
jgi:hypothetical protein